jgi:hypothetical protein
MRAWQKEVRERKAAEVSGDLFGDWWRDIDTSIDRADVRPVTFETAKAVIEEYEWLGTMPHICLHAFGIFFDGACGGVVTYSTEYCENLGRWDQYGFTGKIILLSRGACVHWAHPHAGSKLIRASMRMLPPRYEVVTAMTDRRAGEYGTIYQACGFDYVGALRERTGLVARQDTVVVDGRMLAHRTTKQRFGTGNKKKIAEMLGDRVSFVPDIDKDRYFAFLGAKHIRRRNRAKIAHLIRPYPKREQSSGRTEAIPSETGAAPVARSIFPSAAE